MATNKPAPKSTKTTATPKATSKLNNAVSAAKAVAAPTNAKITTPSGSTPTTITMASGQNVSGYISNGKSYYSNGQRIGEGDSVTDNSGKVWTMKGGTGVQTGDLSYNVNNQRYNTNAQTGATTAYEDRLAQQTNDMYEQQLAAQKAALQQAIAKSISEQQTIINNAPQQYQPLRNTSEVQRNTDLRTTLEQAANAGDRGGIGRQAALDTQTNADNRINDINLQQQNVIDTANKNIADIQNSGSLQEQQIASSNAAAKIQALIEQQNTDYNNKLKEHETAKSDFNSNITSQYADYQAAINAIDAKISSGQIYDTDGVSLAYKRDAYQAARNKKILDLEQQSYDRNVDAEKASQAWEKIAADEANKERNYQLALKKFNAAQAKKSGSSGSTKPPTYSSILAMYDNGDGGITGAEADALFAKIGYTTNYAQYD